MKKKSKNNYTKIYIFIAFLLLSVIFTFLLNTFDKNQKNHLTFFEQNKNIKMEIGKKHQPFDNSIISNQIVAFTDIEILDRFFDVNNCEHITINVSKKNFSKLRNRVKKLFDSNNRKLIFVERLKEKEKEIFLFHGYFKDRLTHVLLITSLNVADKIKKKQTNAEDKKLLAIIIDDIGSKPNIIQKLISLSTPLTVSILTDEPYAVTEYNQAINTDLFEVLIHLPMQPYSEKVMFSEQTISPSSSLFQIQRLLKRAKSLIPMAQGLNNHQGSLTTADIPTMSRFFTALKEENLFFIDSRTTNNSVAYKMSQEYGIKSSYKDLFLDHVPTIKHSREQFKKILDLFKTKNSIIAIGHPHISTIQAIKEHIDLFSKKSIVFVHVSKLVH